VGAGERGAGGGGAGVAAGAWALTDLQSGEFPGREDASARLPMASTTKIMAALVTLKGGNLDEEVIVSRRTAAFATPANSNDGLVVGDSLSVRELLMATLISSGDDAAYVLAEHFGGGGEAGVEAFVEELNREAERLGLNDTRFENPVGFDARGHHTSARSGVYDTPRDAIPRVPRDGRDGVREHLHAL
jgi:serine-type D-Ala-D-Ala carboxypeptidase (penicillin-binding protein 5/6)